MDDSPLPERNITININILNILNISKMNIVMYLLI
ncbi:hypothetical protein Clst_1571 [Thermoclostridium stercorarium subsp. stercorarium DSM 8532]|nr:hypothetical protein Clst_1571 [Thermoclostridium stercorarium subsp. stercorarium DSM 8532]